MQTLLLWTLALGLALTLTTSSVARPQEPTVDIEAALEVLLEEDSDNDGTPDLTEIQEQTNPLDAEESPRAPAADVQARSSGVPTPSCPTGFRNIGQTLCISALPISARQFPVAVLTCKSARARVATYGDLFTLYVSTELEPLYNPLSRWIGPELVGDDQALCGNRNITVNGDVDIGNFEGLCAKTDTREFWCVRDLQ